MIRRFELAAVAVLALVTLLWTVFPPSGRPQDLDLQVEVKQLEPLNGERQRMEATVRWEWRRRPLLTFGMWRDCIAFSYDQAHWQQLLQGGSMGNVGRLQAAYGEAPADHCLLITGAPAGEFKAVFLRQSSGPDAPGFPLRAQFIHAGDNATSEPHLGWIRSVQAK
ncbi:MAG TPA: hypothetical protein VNT75_14970 [Symbiobacteriaceae bacterium]|nr:hypothetical protein [Symbiobacteriaceae bacterium]